MGGGGVGEEGKKGRGKSEERVFWVDEIGGGAARGDRTWWCEDESELWHSGRWSVNTAVRSGRV